MSFRLPRHLKHSLDHGSRPVVLDTWPLSSTISMRPFDESAAVRA
jgi:hypothetical protein